MNRDIIAKVQSFCFDVYMQNPEKDTWLIFTDGTNLGYLQENRLEGPTLSTVHIPNQTTGTGFQIERYAETLTKEDLLRCFMDAPSWASNRDRASVKKWRDINAFINSNSFNKEYRLVPKDPAQ